MTQIEKPASANSKHPVGAADQSDSTPHASTRNLPLFGLLAAIALVAGAWYFYNESPGNSEPVSTTSTGTTSDNTESSTTQTPPAADSAAVPAQSPTTAETTGTSESGAGITTLPTLQTHPKASKRLIAKTASKPARSVAPEPRDRRLALTTRPQPTYPAQALRNREEGTVLVLAQVDVNGDVTDARVVGRSGSATLDRAASKEVSRWKFEPALRNGQPVVASVEVPVSYRLNQ